MKLIRQTLVYHVETDASDPETVEIHLTPHDAKWVWQVRTQGSKDQSGSAYTSDQALSDALRWCNSADAWWVSL